MAKRVKTDYHSKGYKHRIHRAQKNQTKNHRKKRNFRVKGRLIEMEIERKKKKFKNHDNTYNHEALSKMYAWSNC